MTEFGVSLPNIGMRDPQAVRLVAEQADRLVEAVVYVALEWLCRHARKALEVLDDIDASTRRAAHHLGHTG